MSYFQRFLWVAVFFQSLFKETLVPRDVNKDYNILKRFFKLKMLAWSHKAMRS